MPETCENCGLVIGNLETPRIFDGYVVCVICDDKLRHPADRSGVMSPPTPSYSPMPFVARPPTNVNETVDSVVGRVIIIIVLIIIILMCGSVIVWKLNNP
jgi:hypothetical protein